MQEPLMRFLEQYQQRKLQSSVGLMCRSRERVVVVDFVNTFSESVDFIKIVRHNRTGLLKLLLQFGRYGCDIAVSDFCEAVGRRLYGNERVGESVEYQPRPRRG